MYFPSAPPPSSNRPSVAPTAAISEKKPTENDLTFVAPEGVYSVTEEHKPTTTNPHLIVSTPSLYPTHLSTAVVRFPATKQSSSTPAAGLAQFLGGGKDRENRAREIRERELREREREREREKDDGRSISSSDNAGTDEDANSGSPDPLSSPTQQQQQLSNMFSPAAIALGKKKSVSRPKHNIRTTTSTFVTRLQTVEGLTKILQAKQGDVTFLFYNSAKNFFWTEVGTKIKEPLARITFSAYPTCHNVNLKTASHEGLDIVIGFNTGDLVWFEPISGRYVRLNKQGCISNSPCTAVRWTPTSATLFLVSHADGTVIAYDSTRDDSSFTPAEPIIRVTPRIPLSPTLPAHSPNAVGTGVGAGGSNPSIPSEDSDKEKEWNPLESIFSTKPKWHPSVAHMHMARQEKGPAKNPVFHWRVSQRSVVDMAFQPESNIVAVISEDGCLRIIDGNAETLLDCFASYFGSFTCISWSEDGRFILTGGQDDLVTVYSYDEKRVLARCQGHSSFVSCVAFDPWRSDSRSFRFGSVGEDNKLILWDFSSGALHRPKLQSSYQHRVSMSSTTLSSALRRRTDAGGSTIHLPPPALPGEPSSVYHPAPSRNEVAVVQPVLIKHIDCDLLTAISFTPGGLLTAAKSGHAKYWIRPLAIRPRPPKKTRTYRNSEES